MVLKGLFLERLIQRLSGRVVYNVHESYYYYVRGRSFDFRP